ncbi:extracellular ribonuclease [Janibacter sp. HTCC2649]|uniref:endonuclease n=1 Tax=Janibacter sp. HTCC2649 TaxID=313589 RepID=UPI0000671AAE|nr:endonuclease [Janibacter sp. HTCC2649]EAP98200.1 extracellular ribonuclease [Janibacter sp. HTCC2649]
MLTTAPRAPLSSRSQTRVATLAALLLVALISAMALTAFTARTATAATPLTVTQAIATQNGTSQTVRGYVVGEPVATTTVNRSSFTGDLAIALADTAGQTDTTKMVYVQLTTQWRSAWGLKTNPSLLGKVIDVTGPLEAYFAHAGLKSPTAISSVGTTPTPTGTATPTPTPTPTSTGGGDTDTYYASALGKTGSALRTSLHSIIKNQTVLTYDQVWDALKDTDQDPGNSANVIEIYSGRSIAKSNNGGGVDQWNREHVWAKSHGDFGTANGPGTDVHHLRPEDVTVNSDRGSLDFDNGGSAVNQCSDCWRDSDSFEPRDAVKGDVARMILYMAIRYEGDDGWPNLEPNNSVANGSAPYIGKLTVLKAWSAGDPPDTFEKRRNDRIYAQWQHNRNPFIDHPEWVTSIWP